MAENSRTQIKAAIKRASLAARNSANKLDRKALDELTELYKQSSAAIQQTIDQYSGADGNVKIESLSELLNQTNQRIDAMATARNALLDDRMLDAASLATAVFQPLNSAVVGVAVTQIAHDAVLQIHKFIAEDGLQLSDRLWRIDNHAKQFVGDAIQTAVIQGHSASKAALDFISQGQSIPGDLASKMSGANAGKIGKTAAAQLMAKKGSPYANALRVFRTEINRAHGNAYEVGAFNHPDVIGTRFLLSPNHPQVDICDMHAKVNRYGLGAGVYPKGKSPWPAHPNTLSYIEAVFSDEVTAEDKSGKEDRISFLQKQTVTRQNSILGQHKGWMLRDGRLRENAINTPWNILKKRLEKAGVVPPAVDANLVSIVGDLPWRENAQHAVWHQASFTDNTVLHEAIKRHDPTFKGLLDAPGKRSYYSVFDKKIHMSRPMGGGRYPRSEQGTWRHEYGHFLDNAMGESQSNRVLFISSTPSFADPMVAEAKKIIESSGFGRRSKKQSALFSDNATALSDIINDMVEAGADGRPKLLANLAGELDLTIDDVKLWLSKDTLIEIDTIVGQIRTAQVLTAAKRKDVYNLLNVLTEGDFRHKDTLYNKGLIGKFSDLIGSASKNKVAGHGPGGIGGHKTSYYSYLHDQTTEVFANYTALLGAKETFWTKLMVHLMPETTLKYREIIKHE